MRRRPRRPLSTSAKRERWKELVPRCERRRVCGAAQTLEDHVKRAVIDARVPLHLEQHLVTHRSRLLTYIRV